MGPAEWLGRGLASATSEGYDSVSHQVTGKSQFQDGGQFGGHHCITSPNAATSKCALRTSRGLQQCLEAFLIVTTEGCGVSGNSQVETGVLQTNLQCTGQFP